MHGKEVNAMPWKRIEPMDQKIQLIADWQTKKLDKTDLSKNTESVVKPFINGLIDIKSKESKD